MEHGVNLCQHFEISAYWRCFLVSVSCLLREGHAGCAHRSVLTFSPALFSPHSLPFPHHRCTITRGGLLSSVCACLPLPPPKIVKPLWEPFVALFPKLKPLLESLNRNCEYYRQEGLRLERIRLATTSDSPSPQHEDREGHDNNGSHSDRDTHRACGGDDQASPPAKEEWEGAGKAAAGGGGGHRPVSSKYVGGG